MVDIAFLPHDVAAGAEIDITWSTAKATSEGGITGRKTRRDDPIRIFHIDIGPEEVAELRKIYLSGAGPRWPVGIRDWSDYEFTDEVLEYTQDTSFTYAPLRKLYQPATGSRSFHQRILLPDQTEIPLTIKVDGTPLDVSDWTLTDFGIVTIDNSLLPTSAEITASGRFVYPACFAEDMMTLIVHEQKAKTFGINGLQLEEILEAELTALTA